MRVFDTTGRRAFLRGSIAAGAALAAGPLYAAAPRDRINPSDVGRKFGADGRVLPFPGNTVICHMDQQGERAAPFNALLQFYREVSGTSYSDAVAVLPPSSYHMTLLGIATDAGRKPAQWPRGIAPDAPIAECDRIVGERLKRESYDIAGPFRMIVADDASGYDGNTLRLPIKPADPAEAERILTLRRKMSAAARLPAAPNPAFQFHITLAYLVRPLSPSQLADVNDTMVRLKDAVRKSSPAILFDLPEYCTFADMFAFERQFFLR